MTIIHKILGFCSLFIILVSCKNTSEDIKTVSLNGVWSHKLEQRFDFDIKDAENPKNIIFVVRNNNDYPYSNIRFIVNFTNLKSKKKETDTLNYIMAKPNGEWIGSGFGGTKEILFQYKMNYRFPNNGTYRFGVIQAMRNNDLPGIEDIGIKIENSKP